MTQTPKETADVLVKKKGKDEALKGVQEGIEHSNKLYELLKDEGFLKTAQYWKEVEEEIEKLQDI